MITDITRRAAETCGDRTALVTHTATLSYSVLHEHAQAFAAGLLDLGVEPGDRVSLYAANSWEWIVAYHGALQAGAVVNPINVMLTAEEVSFVTRDCGARVLVGSEETTATVLGVPDLDLEHVISFGTAPPGARSFDAMLHDGRGRDVSVVRASADRCSIAYTSGTTGHPKGAIQSHRAVYLNCALTGTMHIRTERDTVVTALPAPHVYGNVVINSVFLAGGTVVLMERFDAGEALRLIDEHAATMFEGVPTMYAMMLAAPELEHASLASLTRCTVGGQTISAAVVDEWQRRSQAPLIELWGMTEIAGLGSTHAFYAPNVVGSIGVALPGIELMLESLDEPGRPADSGQAGQLMVRGPIVMDGYFGNDAATADTITADGWLRTGDVATVDDEGHYFVVDRLKDMIITGGFNVYPAEIERVLAGHPDVMMVAVGGIADAIKGELAKAYVVAKPGATATEVELMAFCREHLAAYKVPRAIGFVDELPKTSTGKVMRRELHKLD